MKRTDAVFLAGAAQALADVRSAGSCPNSTVNLDTLGALLRLLQHDMDTEFHVRHFARGLELMRQGLQALGNSGVTVEGDLAADVRRLPQGLSPDWGTELLTTSHDHLQRLLGRITAKLASRKLELTKNRSFFTDLGEWENEFYAHLIKPVSLRAVDGHTAKLDAESIQAYLRRRFPDEGNLRVANVHRMSGGYGRATALIELESPLFGTRELVLRAELPVSILTLQGIDITTEFRVLKLAFQNGIPAPEPLLLESGHNETGVRFVIVRRLPGKNVGSAYTLSESLSPRLLENLVAGLVAIHTIDLRKQASLVRPTHLQAWMEDSSTTQAVARWIEMWWQYTCSSGVESPLLAVAYTWLRDNISEVPDPPQLLHSDYGFGNLLIENDQVTAVLDWEATHLGDPAEEVGWLIYSLRGTVTEAEILRLYERAGGSSVSDYRLRYFDVFTVVKLATCGLVALQKYKDIPGSDPAFCLLASLSIEPFTRQIPAMIARAEAAKGGGAASGS